MKKEESKEGKKTDRRVEGIRDREKNRVFSKKDMVLA